MLEPSLSIEAEDPFSAQPADGGVLLGPFEPGVRVNLRAASLIRRKGRPLLETRDLVRRSQGSPPAKVCQRRPPPAECAGRPRRLEPAT